jgi:hypothetical protein
MIYRNAIFTSKKFLLRRTATRKGRTNKTKKEPAFFVEYVALEDGADRLSRNVVMKVPISAA